MKCFARLSMAAYVLAILVAGLAPHCEWMFAGASARPVTAMATGHANHASAASKPHQMPAGDCASMELAKSVGPLPAGGQIAPPDMAIIPAIVPPSPPVALEPVRIELRQPRGPPRGGGFAAIFAENHRLLI